jgi:protein pelota
MEAERLRMLNDMFKSALKNLGKLVDSLGGSIIIVGLGFIKDGFLRFMRENSPNLYGRILDVKSVNSAGKAGIFEAIRSGVLTKAFERARIIEEAAAVEELLKRLSMGRGDAVYGLSDVERASVLGAVEEILVTDEKLRESSGEEMAFLENLIRNVESKNGRVRVISVEHEAGVKLKSLGGVAALLRFPIS